MPNQPRIALLGVPIEIGASQLGTLMGPDALRTAGIGRILDQLGFAVEDHGNMAKPDVAPDEGPPPANAKYYDDDQGLDPRAQRTFLFAGALRRRSDLHGRRSLAVDGIGERRRALLAGAGPAAVRAVARRPCRLQHAADRRRPATCTACRRPSCAARAASTGCSATSRAPRSVPTSSTCSASARSIREEKKLVFERRVAIADMRAIDEFGVGVLIRKVIERVRAQNGVLHLSLRRRFPRSRGRARRRHHGAGRRDLSRGASDHGAAARFRIWCARSISSSSTRFSTNAAAPRASPSN